MADAIAAALNGIARESVSFAAKDTECLQQFISDYFTSPGADSDEEITGESYYQA